MQLFERKSRKERRYKDVYKRQVPVGAPRIIFTIGSKSGDWNSSNDFSCSKLNQNFVTASNIPVYVEGELMGGCEPF